MAENKVGEAKKMAAEAKGTIREFWRKSIEPNLMKWFLILLGILILMLGLLYSLWVWLTSKVVEVSKKVPEVAEQVGEGIVTISPPPAPSNIWLYLIGTIFFIFLVYLANKWKDEPDLIKMKPGEKKAEVKKLIAWLIMLILGSVLLGVAAQLYAVNFQGINLTKSLFFLFIAIGLANLILQPGTGTTLAKTFIFCSCLLIALSVYGIYKGWQPIPKEKRVVAAIKEQSCQAELAVPMQEIKEIRASLEQVITKEKRRELIEVLEKEEENCEEIRSFYRLQRRQKKIEESPQKVSDGSQLSFASFLQGQRFEFGLVGPGYTRVSQARMVDGKTLEIDSVVELTGQPAKAVWIFEEVSGSKARGIARKKERSTGRVVVSGQPFCFELKNPALAEGYLYGRRTTWQIFLRTINT